MEPLTPEQGGVEYDPVHQRDDGTWWVETPAGDNGPYLSEIGAREGLKAYLEAEAKTKPHTDAPVLNQVDEDLVELDPETAEGRLTHAAQHVVDAAVKLIRNNPSIGRAYSMVRSQDLKYVKDSVEKFEVAYATVVTLSKVMALAAEAEQQTPLGDQVVDATYGEVPQSKLDERYETMIAERERELAATEGQGDDPFAELKAQAAEWPLPPESCPPAGSDLAECLGAPPQEP